MSAGAGSDGRSAGNVLVAGNWARGYDWAGRGRSFQAQRALAKRQKMGRFAQVLADSLTGNISEAARAVGISQQTGSIYFREICGGLGWQCLTPCNCERCLERRAA